MSHVDEGLLHAYLDGAFPPGDAQYDAISAHLALCADCRARLEEARTVKDHAVDVLRQLVPAPVRPAPAGGFADVVARAAAARRAAAAEAAQAAEAVTPGSGVAAVATGAGGDATPGARRRFVPLAWAASVALALAAGWMAREVVLPTSPPAVLAAGEERGGAVDRGGVADRGDAAGGMAGGAAGGVGSAAAAADARRPLASAPAPAGAPLATSSDAGLAGQPAPGGVVLAAGSGDERAAAGTTERAAGSSEAAASGAGRDDGARPAGAREAGVTPSVRPPGRIVAIAQPEPPPAVLREGAGLTDRSVGTAAAGSGRVAVDDRALTTTPPTMPPPALASQAAVPPPAAGLGAAAGQRTQAAQGAVGGVGLADDARQRLGRDAGETTSRGLGVIGRVFGRAPRAAEPPPPAWRRATVDEATRRFGGPVLQVADHRVDGIWIVEEGSLWSVRVVQVTDAGATLTLVQWRDAPPPAQRGSPAANAGDAEPLLLRVAERPDGSRTAIFELHDGSRLSIEAALPLAGLLEFARRLTRIDG